MQTFKTTTIDTERLRIRPITLEDAEAIYEIRSHHDVYKWTIAGQWHDPSLAKTWIKNTLKNETGFNFAIELASTPPLVIGSLGSPNQSTTTPSSREIGYMFLPSHWGKGYATETLQGFLKSYYAILGRGVGGKIVACTDAENLGSQGVLRKSGFREVRREEYENVTLGTRMEVVFEFELSEEV